MSKKTTVTEYFDENGNITSRITETEDVYTTYRPSAWETWLPLRYPVDTTLKS